MQTLREKIEQITFDVMYSCVDEVSVDAILALFQELEERLSEKIFDKEEAGYEFYSAKNFGWNAARSAMLECIKKFKEGE